MVGIDASGIRKRIVTPQARLRASHIVLAGNIHLGAPLRRLSETLLPGFEAEIVTSRIITPQDFQDRLLSVKGAAFGLEPVLTQSAWFRPHNRSEDVEGLYLVGAGTHPGAGLPGVLSSARVLDSVVPDAAALH